MHKNRFLSSNNQPPHIQAYYCRLWYRSNKYKQRYQRRLHQTFFHAQEPLWKLDFSLHFALCTFGIAKKRRHCLWGGRLQKNWAAQFLLSHQLTQAFSGESETAPMILNSFQTFLYYAYSSRKTQCSGRLLEHRGCKIYNFPTFYVISNDVFRLLATFWTSQSTHGTDS